MFDQNAERDWLEKLEKTHPSSILDLASDRALLPKLWLALAKVPGSQSKYGLKYNSCYALTISKQSELSGRALNYVFLKIITSRVISVC